MTSDERKCPVCGEPAEIQGSVFIEDGPWNGREYVNEGDFTRYRCTNPECKHVFADAPEPMTCSKCGEYLACSEVGEDCEEDPEHEDQYVHKDCDNA